MKHFFRPVQIIVALAGFVVGVFGNVAANLLSGSSWPILLIFMGILILSIIALLFLRPAWRVRIGAPISLYNQADCERYAKRGIIGVISLYKPIKVPSAEQLKAQDYLNAARNLEYKKLDLERSSLEPLIQAIASHSSRLEHCWLITTGGNNGSSSYAAVLIEYLRNEKGLAHCQFHADSSYTLEPEKDDAEIVRKTRDMIERIYEEALKEYQLSSQELIADFTGGPRTISLGLILGCLDGSRDIQLMGTEYDDNAQPVGDLTPMIFDFEMELINKDNGV